jgi:hypothetical protein
MKQTESNNEDRYVGIEIAPTTPSDNWPVIPYGASYVSREYVDIFSWFSDSIPEGLQVEIDGTVVTLNSETRLDYITKIAILLKSVGKKTALDMNVKIQNKIFKLMI